MLHEMRPLRHTPTDSVEERRVPPDEPSGDLFDVPAAVVCAFCGDADCSGCTGDLSRSGIVAIVAWERSQMPLFARLWSTARATTHEPESFFECLPDGPILPALRFAATCELLAVTAMLALLVPVAAVVAPGWLVHLVRDPEARGVALRLVVFGVPAFATLLVAAHAAHGWSIDIGASRSGARSVRRRAARFGLYACGWDLVMGPIGLVVAAVKEGGHAALEVLALASNRLPTRATKAFVRGAYGLDGVHAKRAIDTSYVGAVIATIVGVFVIGGAFVALLLA